MVVTVDNGISALEEICYAKELDFTVVVLDHHLPPVELPEADVIVDPHIHPDKNGFVDYCGAGLALKLAELMLTGPDTSELLKQLTILAAIGTIADVVPLIGDNRRIVKEGLELLRQNKFKGLDGLKALIEEAEVYNKDEMNVSFKLAPILNAPGRMLDDGASHSLNLLLADIEFGYNEYDIHKMAQDLILINEERKDSVTTAMKQAEDIIADNCMFGDNPLCICLEDVQEGVVGIVAGKLAEIYHVPTFVFTRSQRPGVLKGSGRTYGGVRLNEVVGAAAKYILHGGSHEKAAGLSVAANKFDSMKNAMSDYMIGVEIQEPDVLEYDLEILPQDIPKVCSELSVYAPYGEGNRMPVFRIDNAVLVSRYGSRFKAMGKDGNTLKLYCNGYSLFAFGETRKYLKMGQSPQVDVMGTISINKYQYGSSECQVKMLDFQPAKKSTRTSKLLEALANNGTI